MSQHQQGTATPPPPPPPGPRTGLDDLKTVGAARRHATNHHLGGVAGGLARHFNIDPLVVRILFVVTGFFGGGVLLYAACWLFMPAESTNRAVIDIDDRSRTAVIWIAAVLAAGSVFGTGFDGWGVGWPLTLIAIVAVVVVVAKNRTGRTHPGPLPGPAAEPTAGADTRWEEYGERAHSAYQPPHQPPRRPARPRKRGPILFWFTMALAAVTVGIIAMVDLAGAPVPSAAYPASLLAICGLMLLVGAFYGRAGGLILIGLFAAVGTLVATVVPTVDVGQIRETPTSAEELDQSYDLGGGELIIDLTELDEDQLAKLDGRELDLDLHVGSLVVIVPDEGLDVDATASVEAGQLIMFDDAKNNTTDSGYHDGGEDAPAFDIDADLRFGSLEIITEEAA